MKKLLAAFSRYLEIRKALKPLESEKEKLSNEIKAALRTGVKISIGAERAELCVVQGHSYDAEKLAKKVPGPLFRKCLSLDTKRVDAFVAAGEISEAVASFARVDGLPVEKLLVKSNG